MRKVFSLLMVMLVIIMGNCRMKSELPTDKSTGPELTLTNNQQLIKQLGAEDWQTREKAQKELIQLGEKMIEEYRKLKQQATSDRKQAEKLQSKINNLKSEIGKFTDALRESAKGNEPEIKRRVWSIRQHFYRLTQPKIAFASNRDDGGLHSEIYVMDADGKNPTRLTHKGADDRFPMTMPGNETPAWSPDGTKIAFCSGRNGNPGIWIMSADGKDQIRLTDNSEGHFSPVWSSNGTKIAFSSGIIGKSEIYVIDADGKNQIRLTNNQVADLFPSWSPDGTKIAFFSGLDNNSEIYVMDADGKNQIRLTNNQVEDLFPAWSPDGKRIVFVSGLLYQSKIYVMDADGKNLTKLTDNNAAVSSLTWSPDGTKIAFSLHDGNNSDIYVMDTDGKNQIQLTDNNRHGGYDGSPAWSPLSFPEICGLFSVE
ncbi:MAG: DPP IV N-terminal domain-containing protein [Planctomycetota bacterium]|mgnify:CR=1 FL=1